jgi:excisionase family DNA binding protein
MRRHSKRQAQPGHSGPESVEPQGQTRRAKDAQSVVLRAVQPRLLSIEEAAGYLGLSYWSVKELIAAGDVPLIRVPRPRTMRQHRRAARSGVLRRTLVDVRDLDLLVERWRESSIE